MTAAVITGSTKGIGFGLAEAFLDRGVDVVVTGRTDAAVQDALTRLAPHTGKARAFGLPCDVSDPADVQNLWDHAITEFGRVDYWVNNAGVARTTHDIVDIKPEHVAEMVTSNMLGTMNGCQVALRGMSAQGGGKLFNMLGGGADGKVRKGMSVYGATKRGLRFFTDALIKESAGGKVLVGSLSPGVVVTEGMIREAHEMGPEDFAKQRKVMNILSDHVEDCSPILVDKMMAADKHGVHIKRMSNLTLAKRFASGGRGRDVYARYGL